MGSVRDRRVRRGVTRGSPGSATFAPELAYAGAMKDLIRIFVSLGAVFLLAYMGKGFAKSGESMGLSAPWWAWSILLGVVFGASLVGYLVEHVSKQVESVGESVRRSG